MLRQAVIPVVVFLALCPMAGAAAVALRGRDGPGGAASGWALSSLAVLLLAGAMLALAFVPVTQADAWRPRMMAFLLLTLGWWGFWALTSARGAARGQTAAALAGLLTAGVLATGCVWVARWFVGEGFVRTFTLGNPAAWLAGTLLCSRLCAAGLIAALLAGTMSGPDDSLSPGGRSVLDAIAWCALVFAFLRLASIVGSAQIGVSAGMIDRLVMWHDDWPRHRLMIGVRLLVGVALPAVESVFALWLNAEGQPRAAQQLFAPALLMALIGEAIGAGMTFGFLGLGF